MYDIMIYNVCLKIKTCSCTFLCDQREFQFTSSKVLLIASLFDFLKFQTRC